MEDEEFLKCLFRKWNSKERLEQELGHFELNVAKMVDERFQKMIDEDEHRQKLLQVIDCSRVQDFNVLFQTEEFIDARFQLLGCGAFGNALISFMGRRRSKRVIKLIRCLTKELSANISSGAMTYRDVHKEIMCYSILSKLCQGVLLNDEQDLSDECGDKSPEQLTVTMESNLTSDEESQTNESRIVPRGGIGKKRFVFRANCFPHYINSYLFHNDSESLFNFDSICLFESYLPMHDRIETAAILMEHCGQDLIDLLTQKQIQPFAVVSILKQVIIGLTIAESVFYFEHRDLHAKNITCQPINSMYTKFIYKSQKYKLSSYGYQAKIIDFSYSRITYRQKIYYNDLSFLKLCVSGKQKIKSSYKTSTKQPGPYEEMAALFNQNQWHRYDSCSNLIWIKYLIDELIYHLEFYLETMDKRISMEYLQSLADITHNEEQCKDIFYLFNRLIDNQFNTFVPITSF